LLEDHDPAANVETLEHAAGKEQAPSSEGLGGVLCLGFLVEENGSLDFEILSSEKGIFWGEAAELGERGNAVIIPVLHHEPSRREGQEEHAEEQDPGGDELESERETPRDRLLSQAGVAMGEGLVEDAGHGGSSHRKAIVRDSSRIAVGASHEVKTVIEPESNGGADGDGELLERDQRATELGRGNLGLVEGNHHREHADAETANDSTSE
jgi:hypothetical protein